MLSDTRNYSEEPARRMREWKSSEQGGAAWRSFVADLWTTDKSFKKYVGYPIRTRNFLREIIFGILNVTFSVISLAIHTHLLASSDYKRCFLSLPKKKTLSAPDDFRLV